MMHDHHYSLTELENMLPWERDVYVHMLSERIKEDNKRKKEEAEQLQRTLQKIAVNQRKALSLR